MGLGEKGAQGVCMRSNLILFVLVLVLVLVNRYCVEDEDDDERGPSDFCAQSSVFCTLKPET